MTDMHKNLAAPDAACAPGATVLPAQHLVGLRRYRAAGLDECAATILIEIATRGKAYGQ